MARNPRLTRELAKKIVSSIRSGGYPHVAAQSCRVTPAVFEDWLRRGSAPNAREPYASFAQNVLEASAQARLRAEVEACQKDPKAWLNNGPGRESDGSPGWSAQVKAAAVAADKCNPLADPQLLELFREVLRVLAPYPEARRALADALGKRSIGPGAKAK